MDKESSYNQSPTLVDLLLAWGSTMSQGTSPVYVKKFIIVVTVDVLYETIVCSDTYYSHK